ncbi:MAG: AtpZ/AtpI family protein [Nitrospinaceae bacterium]
MNKSNAFRQGLSIAFRLGTELTVAVMIGAAIGFALDRYLSTKPWLLAVGVVIGGAAGCLNVYRISKEISIYEDTDPNNDS